MRYNRLNSDYWSEQRFWEGPTANDVINLIDTVLQNPRSACFSADHLSRLNCSVEDFADFKVDVQPLESGYSQVIVRCQAAPGFKAFTIKKTFRSEKSFKDELDGYGAFMTQFVDRLWKSLYTPLITYYMQKLDTLSFNAAEPTTSNCKIYVEGPNYANGWGLYIYVSSQDSYVAYVSHEYIFNTGSFSIDDGYDAIDDIMSIADAEIPAKLSKLSK